MFYDDTMAGDDELEKYVTVLLRVVSKLLWAHIST